MPTACFLVAFIMHGSNYCILEVAMLDLGIDSLI